MSQIRFTNVCFKKSTLFVILATMVSSQWALAFDVVPTDRRDIRYIKVTLGGERNAERVNFKLCDPASSTCDQIGKQSFYFTKDLYQKRASRLLRKYATYGVDILVIGGAIGFGAGAGMIFGATTLGVESGLLGLGLAGMGESVVGGSAGAIGGFWLTKNIQAINPREQGRIADTLAENVVNDRDTYVDNLDLFVQRLKTILD